MVGIVLHAGVFSDEKGGSVVEIVLHAGLFFELTLQYTELCLISNNFIIDSFKVNRCL